MITEVEILDAIHRPLGARSLDGVKRPDKSRHGALPIRILFPEGYGDSGKRSPNAG